MHWLLSGPLSVEKLTVKIAGLPASLQGKKLVQMSDFHYDGAGLSDEMLEAAIALSNQVKPDLVILTGDYVTTSPQPIHDLVLKLKQLQTQAGIYAVLGNHDIYYRYSKTEITKALTKIGVRVLWNEVVYPFGNELALVGLADRYSPEFNPAPVMEQLNPNIPRIVLSHNPDTAEILQAWRVDLQLSGHSHGGQIVIPGLGAVVAYRKNILQLIPHKIRRCFPLLRRDNFVLRHWEWAQGLHRVGRNLLYVNRGLGTYSPGRLFCPPEVTVITLQKE
ncbi:metallophosphoesterase [Nostoc spongiaeforme FACHB-130]|uniref:Metallophosphoesterase n=1 Tax=Nostoc spongiaeforme FACHB-130 TaxID=1357510 RepID=A0ABR8G513_9NOSO|nr:metallophosphoesterase [Nostoc spongiaeforme]MBD2598239.1 metallophosphoesterase [Nostoc spongiaeforme FACHB-130]